MCLVGFGLNSEITPRPPPQARSAPTQEPQRCSNYDFWCEQPFLVSSTYMYKPQIQRSDPSIEVPYAVIDCASSVLTTSVAQILYFVLCLNVAMPRQLISRNGCPSTVYYWAAHDLSVYAQRELRARELSNSVEDALTMTEPCPAHGDFVVTRDADSFADTSPPECSPMDCSEPQVCLDFQLRRVHVVQRSPTAFTQCFCNKPAETCCIQWTVRLQSLKLRFVSCTCVTQMLLQDFGRPEACSFLQAGQEFDGTQRVSQAPANLSEDWGVQVSIEVTKSQCTMYFHLQANVSPPITIYMQEVNWETGYVCGSMRAENVPQAKTPVVTFWEGDIIDNVNHSFVTSKWGAEKKVDVKHWKRFDGFQSISNHAEAACGRYTSQLSNFLLLDCAVSELMLICNVGCCPGVLVCPRTHIFS